MLTNLRYKLSSFSWQFNLTTPSANYLAAWQYIFLGLLTFFSCYFGLASYPILDMNEGLYAEIAREMLVNKDFIIPHLNNVPYLEKPPFLYWLITLSYHFFGVNAFAARLIPSTFTALTCWSWVYFGKKIQAPRKGWIISILLLSSFVFLMIGRTVFFDMLLTFFITTSLMSFYLWFQQKERSFLYFFYIFLGLGVLTKGCLVLVIIPMILFLFLWLVKAEKKEYYALIDKKALIVFLGITVPWHLLALLEHPSFFWEYFINNQLLRFFDMRVPHDYHTGPFYYYIPRVIAYLLPWTLLLPFVLSWPLRLKQSLEPLNALMLIWFLVTFVFFSLSGDKGDYYLVIGIPPIAYFIANKIEAWFESGKASYLTGAFALMTLTLTMAGIIALLFYRSTQTGYTVIAATDKIPFVLNGAIATMIVVCLLYGALGIYLCFRNRSNPLIPFYLLVGLIVPMLFFYLTVKERTQLFYSQVALANFVKMQYEYRPVYLYQDFETVSSFVYYNREPSTIIDSKSADLYYGSTTSEGKKLFISLTDFMQQAKQRFVYVVVRTSRLPSFEKMDANHDFCAVQRNGNVVLLSNAPSDCKANIAVGEQKDFDLDTVKTDAIKNEKI